MRKMLVAAAAAVFLLAPTASAVATSESAATPRYTSCKQLNKKYPHGVGRKGARDHTSGKRVTNFTRSNKVYWRYSAGKAKTDYRDLDRDNDGIACEKR